MKRFIGLVVSDKMMKSVVVAVERFKPHPKYPKIVRSTKKFMAHDAESTCRIGDQVQIETSRPISKRKCWVVTEILRRARVYDPKDLDNARRTAEERA